jgi:hypothetical protein
MNQQTTVHTADRADPSDQGPVLLHVWMLEPHMADRHFQLLQELFEEISDQPGFVSARILASPGRTSIATIVEMQRSRIVSGSSSFRKLTMCSTSCVRPRTWSCGSTTRSHSSTRGLRGSHPAQAIPD